MRQYRRFFSQGQLIDDAFRRNAEFVRTPAGSKFSLSSSYDQRNAFVDQLRQSVSPSTTTVIKDNRRMPVRPACDHIMRSTRGLSYNGQPHCAYYLLKSVDCLTRSSGIGRGRCACIRHTCRTASLTFASNTQAMYDAGKSHCETGATIDHAVQCAGGCDVGIAQVRQRHDARFTK